MKERITLLFKGLAMGIAEVIPGVSGGTIAFITGIYETLLRSIKSILGPEAWQSWRRDGLAGAWRQANGPFLVPLITGMVIGLVTGVFGVSHLLENYPPVIWAFFFGLILASVLFIGRQVGKWDIRTWAGFLLAALVAYFITEASPAQGPEALWFVFLSGALAISALMLPGISGSFILLLLGMYTYIIGTVKEVLQRFTLEKAALLFVFGLGCLVGLASFSRVLSWLFAHHRKSTLATLTGFMLGSLNKVWPWRNVVQYRVNSKGEQVPFLEDNVLPVAYEGEPLVVWAIGAAILGFLLVFLLERLDKEAYNN